MYSVGVLNGILGCYPDLVPKLLVELTGRSVQSRVRAVSYSRLNVTCSRALVEILIERMERRTDRTKKEIAFPKLTGWGLRS
jgi:hypothetical protein